MASSVSSPPPPSVNLARMSNYPTQGITMSAEDLKLKSGEYAKSETDWSKLCPEMLDMIFHHLPVADLLSCGMVCKAWKTAARDVLQTSRECYAYIRNFRTDIQDLNEMMDGMDMINGLYIQNRIPGAQEYMSVPAAYMPFDSCADAAKALQCEKSERNLDEAKQSVLKVLGRRWKYIAVDLRLRWSRTNYLSTDDCLLVREVISATSGSLQMLLLGEEHDWIYVPCCKLSYPKLKKIQVEQELLMNPHCNNYSLETMAPNLEKITGAMIKVYVINGVDSFTVERMKGMWIQPFGEYLQDEHQSLFRSVSGLRGLNLQGNETHRSNLCDPEQLDMLLAWNAFDFPLVLRNFNTLVELRMITTEFYKLVVATAQLKFPTLQRLSLTVHENSLPCFKQLNLPKLCPNLKQVHLLIELPEVLDGEVVIALQVSLELGQSDQPLRVELECMENHGGEFYRHDYIQHLNKMYPNIDKVKFVKLDQVNNENEMSKIFSGLNALEYLELSVALIEGNCAVDPILSGINEEEAALPFREDAVIVPIRPSLLNAKSLKELRIVQQFDDDSAAIEAVSQSWVTQITENGPNHHVRHLKVTFEGSEIFVDELCWRAFSTCASLRNQIDED